ncbi:MAG: hypothetical protein IH870_06050 [Chloroflexi bacterium]|nr:hypothetical protein [Chloroflexota bacterium]
MQEVASLTQIFPLVAAGASVLLALGAAALSGIFFFMSTRRNSRAEAATGRVESSTKQLSRLYERMYRDSLARDSLMKKQNSGGEQVQKRVQTPAQPGKEWYPVSPQTERG